MKTYNKYKNIKNINALGEKTYEYKQIKRIT